MNTFPISDYVINELKEIKPKGIISNPRQLFEIGSISFESMKVINTKYPKVFISKMALKHIIDQRESEEIIYLIPEILSNPTKIVDNSLKRLNSFIFAKMNGKYNGAVLEITKTPDCENQVVSAFPIDPRTYRKLEDISGRPDVPP
jgi:hypothetical protein